MKNFLKQEVNSTLAIAFVAVCATAVGFTAQSGVTTAEMIEGQKPRASQLMLETKKIRMHQSAGQDQSTGERPVKEEKVRPEGNRPCVEAMIKHSAAMVAAWQAHLTAVKEASALTNTKEMVKAIEEANKALRAAQEGITPERLRALCKEKVKTFGEQEKANWEQKVGSEKPVKQTTLPTNEELKKKIQERLRLELLKREKMNQATENTQEEVQ